MKSITTEKNEYGWYYTMSLCNDGYFRLEQKHYNKGLGKVDEIRSIHLNPKNLEKLKKLIA